MECRSDEPNAYHKAEDLYNDDDASMLGTVLVSWWS